MNEHSVSKSFHINFEEKEMPDQITLVGNHGRQDQAANAHDTGRKLM